MEKVKGTGNFLKDLELGHIAEEYVSNYLTDYKGCRVVKNTRTDYAGLCEYDLLVTSAKGTTYKTEVKEDFLFEVTGNVAVEEKCMKHSKADAIMYKLGDEIYVIKRDRLLNLMVDYRVVYNGRGNILYLIPYVEFINITKKIK